MPAPATIDDFLDVVRKSNQVDPARLEAYLNRQRQDDTLPPDPRKFAALLVRDGLLTNFQAEQFLQGKYRGFHLGGYRILERLGAGGTGAVYLGEHEVMKRRVALKVLPPSVATTPGVLERFRREAQAVAALDHPNIVRAYDFRQEGQIHFLVMEYVNGPSLQQVIESRGPLALPIACEYVRQAAIGLQHAHEAGLVHRDIKPGNLLVDPSGIVKILDLGLARFAPEGQESLTRQFDENTVMGTADYLAPEQALNLHNVDSRADIYSLGGTLYALLAGTPPFGEGTVTQKLLWHQMRDPVPIDQVRSDVPPEVGDLIATMMAKDPAQRFQSVVEIAEAIAPFCSVTPIPQGPARPGESNGNGTGSYVQSRRMGPVTAARKMQVPGADAFADRFPRKLSEQEEIDRRQERDKAVRAAPEDTGSMVGILLLGGVMAGLLLLVVGVVGFLLFGPSPTVTSKPVQEEEAPRAKNVPKMPMPQPAPPPLGMPKPLERVELPGNAAPMDRLAFTPDNRRLAVAGKDRTVYIWDVMERRHIGTARGHTQDILAVRFGSNGTALLTGSADGTARIWGVPQGNQIKQFTVPGGQVSNAIYARTEEEILTSADDGVIRLWNVASGKEVKQLVGHKGPVTGLLYRPGNPNRNHVVSASLDGTLQVWDLGTGKPVRTLQAHPRDCLAVALNGDGQLAVTGGGDATLKLWELDTGKLVHTFAGHSKPVAAVAISLNGQWILSGGSDPEIKLWSLPQKTLRHGYAGHSGPVQALVFTSDSKHFASCGLDRKLFIWGLP